MNPRCPIYDRACSTAYNAKRCRCDACREWNAQHSRRGRPEGNRTFQWSNATLSYTRRRADRRQGIVQPTEPVWIPSRKMEELWADFDSALKADPIYVIRIAEAARRVSESAYGAGHDRDH